MLAFALAHVWETIDTAGTVPSVPYFQLFVVAEVVCQVVLLAGLVAGLVMIFKRHFRTPVYYQLLLAFVVVFGLIELAGTYLTFGVLADLAGDEVGDDASLDTFQAYASGARMIVWALIWTLYWRRSKRVANTFPAPQAAE